LLIIYNYFFFVTQLRMNNDKLLLTKNHIWVKPLECNHIQVGISDYAQDLLGDIVFIELKENELISSGDPFGVIESVKTASDLVSPCDLKITRINSELLDNLTDVNDRPYESWICEVKALSSYETMSIDDYEKLVG